MPAPFRILCCSAALVLAAAGSALAVAPVGKAKRIDKDAGTSIYGIHTYQVARTAPGGFAVGWNEYDEVTSPQEYQAIRFRVYDKAFAPAGSVRSADLTDRTAPFMVRLLPLGKDKLLLVFGGKAPPAHVDDPGARQVMAHVIALANGKPGPRLRLDNKATGPDTMIQAANLKDGRVVVGWYQDTEEEDIPGRFVKADGTLAATKLQLACCDGGNLLYLGGLGKGFVGLLRHTSIFNSTDKAYGQLYTANGAPTGAPKDLKMKDGIAPITRALANGRTVAMRYIAVGDHRKLVARIYDQSWKTIGKEKTLIPDVTDVTSLDFAPTPGGGLLMVQNIRNASDYTRRVTYLNAKLKPAGAAYSITSDDIDYPRVAALGASRAVLVFRTIENSRSRLFFRILSY